VTAAGVQQVRVSSEIAAELEEQLARLAGLPGVRRVLLVDRAGRVLADAGDSANVDVVTFAALAAADFGANEQLARLVGELNFRGLVHHGDSASVHVMAVSSGAVLVTLFNAATPPGLVPVVAEDVVGQLSATVDSMGERAVSEHDPQRALLGGAEEEIDRLFDW
jgi:predicted regulator of Ras-like GTPase activity (Roadblock/LC7/MglB family)